MDIGFHTFPNGKQYACVSAMDARGNPARVFLRNILFIRNPANPSEVAIVREWGANSNRGVWEPPKGQMEWKEFKDAGMCAGSRIAPERLMGCARTGVLREVAEEAKFLPSELDDMQPMGCMYTEQWADSGLKDAYFSYQFWQATAKSGAMFEAQKRMNTLLEHPEWKHILPADMTEKDAVMWWKPADGWDMIRGAFSKKMTKMYFK
jgi:hypothetical protein